MARKKRQEEPIGMGWLTTYGDMVTLVLTFFVLLFSFSSLDVEKFRKMVISFKGALGALPGGSTFQESQQQYAGQVGLDAGEVRKQTQNVLEMTRLIQTLVSEEGLQKEVTVRVDQRGVTISISEQVLFARGAAKVEASGRRLLAKIGAILKGVELPVAIEGHTDNIPVRGGLYETNWGLSSMRAADVAAYFTSVVGIDPRRLEARGFGEFRPLVPNDTQEHMALNRRIDVVVLSQHSQ